MDLEQGIQALLDRFSAFGQTPDGGITRLLYDEAWQAFQRDVQARMREAGMEAGADPSGNVIGRYPGTEEPERRVVTGSHADTVENGGRLDGQFGIAAGILAAEELYKTHGPPKRTIEVVAFAEEEGSRFPYTFWGVKRYLGLVEPAEVAELVDADGICFADAMREAGYSPEAARTPPAEEIDAFVELHIEQGGTLEHAGQQIGVVEGIVAQRRYTVLLRGAANHAGTTAMTHRRDALMGFVSMAHALTDKALQWDDPLVLTFGRLEVLPNVPNVIPGEVFFTVDCRHASHDTLRQFTEEMERGIVETAHRLGLEAELRRTMDEADVQMNPRVVGMIEDVCKKRRLSYRRMHSGAGHDSQIMTGAVPAAMIFVPSIGGISHSPLERTDMDDLVRGVEVLRDTLYRLAYE